LEFNQSEGRKPISSLVNLTLIGQNSIQSQSQSLVWYEYNAVWWREGGEWYILRL